MEGQLAALKGEDRSRDEFKNIFDKYIVRARGCKLEWAGEARVLRRHNAHTRRSTAIGRRIGREMNLGGVCRRPPLSPLCLFPIRVLTRYIDFG